MDIELELEPELTYTFLLNYYIKHQLHHQKLPKVPEYSRKAYKDWYSRNKDTKEFKERVAIANRKAYEKRKARVLTLEKDLLVKEQTN